MNGHYYLMDDFISLYFHGIWDGYFAYILLAIFYFFAGYIRMAYDHALLWISVANPFLWMTAARRQMRQLGSPMAVLWYEVECLMPLCVEMCCDLRMHVLI